MEVDDTLAKIEKALRAAEKKRQYLKAYYQRNRERIIERGSTKNECSICFGSFTSSHRALHAKSARHQRALKLRTAST